MRVVTTEPTEPATPELREIKALPIQKLVIAESKRVCHHVTLPAGSQLEDMLVPDYWALAAPKLHANDVIEVAPLNGTFWALLLVREVGREFAKTALLQKVELPPLNPPVADHLPLGHSAEFMGPRRLWCAMRGTSVLKSNFSTKTAAEIWIVESLGGGRS